MLNIYHPYGCHLFQRAEPLCDEALFFFGFKKGQLLVSSCLGAGCSLTTDMGRAVGWQLDGWMDDMLGGIFICWK